MLGTCPICGRSIARQGNEYRPFCSERCRSIDLNAWFEEEYRIPLDDLSLANSAPDKEDS